LVKKPLDLFFLENNIISILSRTEKYGRKFSVGREKRKVNQNI
jgi:hypothetical protein